MPTKKRKQLKKVEATPEATKAKAVETVEQRKKEGNKFIQEREKLKNVIGATGRVGEEQATKVLAGAEEIKQAEAAKEAETAVREEKSREFLDERGFFEDQPPQRESLDVAEAQGLDKIPVLGNIVPTMGEQIVKALGLVGDEKAVANTDPETMRELAKRKIQEDTIAEGLSAGERFGAMVESIPVAGSLVGKYASGLIEDPAGNVKTIVTEIASERERASVLAEKLATGKIDPFVGFDELQEMEDNIVRLETRIKLLINSSAQLKADPDAVNKIEEQILRAKERVFMAKLAAGQGATIAPTEASWFYTLQDLKGG